MAIIEILRPIVEVITSIITTMSYPGIFFLMILESALIPIPSEIIMPFSGFLVSAGKLDVVYVVLAGSFGNLVGSMIAYFVGVRLGRAFVLKYGKYVLLKKSHLELTESYFQKYGDRSTFVSRLLPAVRTYISLPAGVAKMNLKKFASYTLVGSIIWNFALTYLGIKLGEQWTNIRHYSSYFDAMVIAGVIIVIVVFIKRKSRRAGTEQN